MRFFLVFLVFVVISGCIDSQPVREESFSTSSTSFTTSSSSSSTISSTTSSTTSTTSSSTMSSTTTVDPWGPNDFISIKDGFNSRGIKGDDSLAQASYSVIKVMDDWWRVRNIAEIKNYTPDFTKENIIAVFKGYCPDSGHAIKIQKIEERDDKLYVYVFIQNEPPGESSAMRITGIPYHVVSIRKTDKEIVFPNFRRTQCPRN